MLDPFALKVALNDEVTLMKNRFDDLAQLIAEFSQIYADYAKEYGLNFNELHFLYYIGRNKNAHPNDISQRWSIPKQTINSMIKKFQQADIITVNKDPHDGRKKILTLTATGREFILPLIDDLTAAELTAQEEDPKSFDNLLQTFAQIKQSFAARLKK